MRLLQCKDCKTIEQLPDVPKGVDPNRIQPGQDPLLDDLLGRHRFPNGEAHFGNLVHVEEAQWANEEIRNSILKGMGSGEEPGMGEEYYALKSTFHEDALACFGKHGRPEGRCIDWQDDRKLLGRPTKEGQAWQRTNYKAPNRVYLCNFCPVATHVMVEMRAKQGQYK